MNFVGVHFKKQLLIMDPLKSRICLSLLINSWLLYLGVYSDSNCQSLALSKSNYNRIVGHAALELKIRTTRHHHLATTNLAECDIIVARVTQFLHLS